MPNSFLWNPNTMKTSFVSISVFILLTVLTACSSVDALFEPPPTVLKLTFNASENLNVNPEGKAMPLVVRFYELDSVDSFSGADFFALYNLDKETLGSDIQYRKELELAPGDKREIRLPAKGASEYLGVFGAFRDLETAQWRAVAEIPPNKTTAMNIKFSNNSVVIETAKDEKSAE